MLKLCYQVLAGKEYIHKEVAIYKLIYVGVVMKELLYWSMVQKIWGVKGNKALLNILQKINGKDFWHLSPGEISKYFPGISQEMVSKFIKERNELNIAEEYEQITKHNVKIISYKCPYYPERLKRISNPPPLLYVKGDIVYKRLSIAIIGARKASPYGKKVALHLANELGKEGIQIVSGLARGIDAAGHEGCLNSGEGTIAVLGNSLDIVYPRENINLYKRILAAENSAIISEFPISTPPLKYNFPLRNRIISGLADGVVVIEAGEKSGSLITAEFALEQGKEVFVVPGPIDSLRYKGSHKLIKEGAKLIDNIADILEEFQQPVLFNKVNHANLNLNKEEKIVLGFLGSNPVTVDEIYNNCSLSIKDILSILSILEIRGLVKRVSGRKFISMYWGDHS